MIDRAAWRTALWRSGKTERRGGYPRSWRGVGLVWRDMVNATPVIGRMLAFPLARGDFAPSRQAGRWAA